MGMKRIVIVGGRGFFGAAAAELLRGEGIHPQVASRQRGADLLVDAENPDSIRASLLPGDVVIDAAGPFQARSTALVEACVSIGCDVVDLADSLEYVTKIQRLDERIASSQTRVLTACSSVSAVSAALVRLSGIEMPARVSTFLAPATRNTSTQATALSLFAALDRPVRVLRGGSLVERRAFSETRAFAFASPVDPVRARLAESADAVTLPRVWPTLRDVDFWVDTRRSALNQLFALAARNGAVRSVVRAVQPLGRRLTKRFGARSGGFGVEVEDASGRRVAQGFVHESHSYLVAVAPAVLAAKRLATNTFTDSGLILPDRQVDPIELRDWLQHKGVEPFNRESHH
jgi:hypothetical protein